MKTRKRQNPVCEWPVPVTTQWSPAQSQTTWINARNVSLMSRRSCQDKKVCAFHSQRILSPAKLYSKIVVARVRLQGTIDLVFAAERVVVTAVRLLQWPRKGRYKVFNQQEMIKRTTERVFCTRLAGLVTGMLNYSDGVIVSCTLILAQMFLLFQFSLSQLGEFSYSFTNWQSNDLHRLNRETRLESK